MEYTIKTINELCTKITDGSHFSPEHETDGQYPMYSVKDMDYNNFSNADCKMIGQAMFEKLSKADCRPLKNDILIAKDGSYLKCAFKVNEDLNACILSSIAILRPNLKNIDPDYFVYLMRTKSIKGAMSNYVSGSALPRIILSDFKKMKLKMISSLPTQQKIASILSAYDNLIQNYKKQIESLQTAASELYKEWFVRFRFPGWKNAKFENGIPERWKVERIGENCSIKIGGDVPEENSETKDEKHRYPIYSNGINEDGFYGYTDTFKISESSVTISARGTVGFVCLRREPYYPIVRLICLIPRKELGVFYLYHSLKYADLDGNGTSQQQLTAPMVSKRKIVIAEEKLIEKFNSNAKLIYDKIDLLKLQITNLTQQRDLLLPRLMSGKLEVK